MSERKILNRNVLKTIAFIAMVIDHFGLIFYPNVMIYRIIGRLAFPIFAFMISEGARYTSNRLKYFLRVFLSGILFNAVYYYFTKDTTLCIFLTFTLSILLIYIMQAIKAVCFNPREKKLKKYLLFLVGAMAVAAVAVLMDHFTFDYGFFGCLAPVFASIFDFNRIDAPMNIKAIDRLLFRQIAFTEGILVLAAHIGGLQYFSLLALPIIFLYSGKHGKMKLKYFFYAAYPVHLVLLFGLKIYLDALS